MELEIEKYFDRLFPICRSITGDGVRETLKIIREIIPLNIHEVPTGKKVFDWEIPKEWNIAGAYIREVGGGMVCDFKDNNLHVISYSTPVKTVLSYDELLPHLHYLEELPDAIPYLTSYYRENWGFCISYNKFLALDKGKKYEVVIDSELKNGSLTYGDFVLKGSTDKEILFSTYVCHPSMANNEISGVLVTAFLYKLVNSIENRKYTYRFVFVPETIGTINYLYEHGKHFLETLKADLVLTCIGDNGEFHYKQPRKENTELNKVVTHLLKFDSTRYSVLPFSPIGSDERQYCSPGFDLPVGVLSRSIFHAYKEYHTSMDNKEFISFPAMVKTIHMLCDVVRIFEMNEYYINQNPFCEPQLGKRNLYQSVGGLRTPPEQVKRMMNILNYSDGKHDLVDTANKMNENIFNLETVVNILKEVELIK